MPISKLPSAHKSIVIHGPMGCGKTRNGERFRKHFGMDSVVEADATGENRNLLTTGEVILTSTKPGPEVRRQMTFAQAMKLLQGKPGYPF
jgi:hypothetical protein